MPRSIDELEANALRFWPTLLAEREQSTNIIPRLIETQEKFIGVLYVADATPVVWKDVLNATTDLPGNLFLKHLMVLTDVSGETLRPSGRTIARCFPHGIMTYEWGGRQHDFRFSSLPGARSWGNGKLFVDGQGLATPQPLAGALDDVATVLMHGGSCVDPGVPRDIFDRCTVGAMLGRKAELDSFVRQRYIWVSRITGGAKANKMGQLCQSYVREYLQTALPDWNLHGRSIPGMSENAGQTDISFDIVARSPDGKYCAIEVSFQVTTNSTIERKRGQAQARQQLLHRFGHRIAYVIDGIGNLERRAALSAICAASDCTVTLRDNELNALAAYLRTIDR